METGRRSSVMSFTNVKVKRKEDEQLDQDIHEKIGSKAHKENNDYKSS